MRHIFLRIGLFGILLATLGAAPPAVEPGGISLNVVPGKIDVTVRPGAVANLPITVRNDSTSATHIVVNAADFVVNDDGTYRYDAPGAKPLSLATWIAIRPREFDVPANSFQLVQVSLLVPERDLSGEYSGVLLVQTHPARERGSMAFSARFAAKVYATITGTMRRSGRVDRVSAAADGTGNERYRIVFSNTGNVHAYLNGRIEVRRGGAVLQTLALPKNVLVERGGERTIDVMGPRLAPAAYDIVAVVDYGGDERTGGKVHLDAR
jgi:hypothetical protein